MTIFSTSLRILPANTYLNFQVSSARCMAWSIIGSPPLEILSGSGWLQCTGCHSFSLRVFSSYSLLPHSIKHGLQVSVSKDVIDPMLLYQGLQVSLRGKLFGSQQIPHNLALGTQETQNEHIHQVGDITFGRLHLKIEITFSQMGSSHSQNCLGALWGFSKPGCLSYRWEYLFPFLKAYTLDVTLGWKAKWKASLLSLWHSCRYAWSWQNWRNVFSFSLHSHPLVLCVGEVLSILRLRMRV